VFHCRRRPASTGLPSSFPPPASCNSPPSLHATAAVADPGWRSTIDALVAVGARSGVEPAAFGSLLWQHLTDLAYLTPRSDLDVLWSIPADFDVHALVCRIAEIERGAPMRIDGEIVFPDGSAVNWRELWKARQAADRATVLAKTMEGVVMLDLAALAPVAGHA
jgi:phosphoribosyl-dephospho-CoA transferase